LLALRQAPDFRMKKICLLPLFLAFLPLAARAADHPQQVTPISWIVQSGRNIDVDDKYVTMVGKVIRKDNGSDWWFADATGVVRLDTDDKELPVGPTLVVSGHIDQARFGIGHLEVDVKKWHYANGRQ
jgi:uncharacterized protein YdeI (BOF family)